MIYSDVFVDFLKDKTGLGYFNGPHSEIICRCPWCEPESTKNHGHLYVDVEDPIFFCHRCQQSGLVSKLIQVLSGEVEIYIDPEILKKGRTTKTKAKNLFHTSSNEYTFEKDLDTSIPGSELKQLYLQSRLPNMHIMNIPGLVLDPKKFIEDNKIELDDYMKDRVEELNDTYIGFVTTKGKHLILRNCDASSPNRHFKLTIDSKPTFFNDFYGIKVGDVGVANTIVVCEGIFDLLVSIGSDNFKTLRQQSLYWAASLGKAQYRKAVISVLNYCSLPKANIIILADQDFSKTDAFFKIKTLPNVGSVEIYWNRYGNDFGQLPIDPVKVSVDWRRK